MNKLVLFLTAVFALTSNKLWAQCTTPPDPNPMSPIQIYCGSNALIEPTGSNGFYYFFADAAGNLLLDSGTSFQTNALNGDTLFFFAAADVPPNQTFTFTNCGASGRIGPTQVEADAAYSSTNLNGLVNILGSGIQEWTVPATGTYIIEAYGAQGGAAGGGEGGKGAKVVGEFQLTVGQKLHIIVGQQGRSFSAATNRFQASGGGGSFVVFENASDENDILVIAGGGGGFAFNRTINNVDGQIGAAGGSGSGATSGSNGGTNGNGGASDSGGAYGGGGGFSGNGVTGTSRGGRSFLNGGEGGTGSGTPTLEGGFGGGGGVTQVNTNNNRRAGGGGGYSGGGAAHSTNSGTGTTAGAVAGGGGGLARRADRGGGGPVHPHRQAGGDEAAFRLQGQHRGADRSGDRGSRRTRLRSGPVAGLRYGPARAGRGVRELDRPFHGGLSRAMAQAYGPLDHDAEKRKPVFGRHHGLTY